MWDFFIIFYRLSLHWMNIIICIILIFFYLSLIHLSRCWSVDQQCGYLLSIHKGNNNTFIHPSIFAPIYLCIFISISLSIPLYIHIYPSIHIYLYLSIQYFHELTDENVEQLMTLNVNSTTWMTRIALPGMMIMIIIYALLIDDDDHDDEYLQYDEYDDSGDDDSEQLIHYILSGMLSRKRGAIVNIGSGN